MSTSLLSAIGTSILMQDGGGEIPLGHIFKASWQWNRPLLSKPARSGQADPLSLDHCHLSSFGLLASVELESESYCIGVYVCVGFLVACDRGLFGLLH